MAKKNKKVSYNDIQSLSENWQKDERNGLPYSGESVQKFLKKVFGVKAGEFYHDETKDIVLVFAGAAERDEYLDPETTEERRSELLLGSFDAPANYTAEISMATPMSNVILAGKTGNYVDFTFDIKSRTGSSTGESVLVTYTINNAGNIKKITQIYAAGTSVHFLVDQYLSAGNNNISVHVTGRNTLVSTIAAVNYTVVALELTSDFDISQPVRQGDYLAIPYTLSGTGVKYLEWYIDGELQQDIDTITDLKVNRIKNIDTTELPVGKHSVQARAYFASSGTNYYGATLYFDFVLTPADDIWQEDVTYILLSFVLSAPVTSAISIEATQYKEYSFGIAVYDSRSRSLALTISDNGQQIQDLTMVPDVARQIPYIPTTTGNHVLTFSCDEATVSINASVSSGDVDINEVTEDVLLKLSAKGRSNSEVDPAKWVYGNITTTFNGFSWNEQSGWNNGVLTIPAGASIDISFAPLGGNPVTRGRTIEIDYETANIENDDASVISLVNSNTGAGLDITASSAKLQSSGGANVNTKYKDGDRVHLAFIINKTTGDSGRLMFIVNNGILERAASFAATDVFQVGDNLHIGSDGCTVKIHSIRIYDKALTADEAFCNYAVDSDNLVEIASNNDILNESTGLIDADKVNAKVPIMIITGDMQPIFDATSKDATVYVDLEYRNLQDQSKNFTATHVRMRPQGTSSLGYPRKNLRPYTASKYGCVMYDANGEVIENGLYAFKDGAQPVNCWTLKADYAESSGSHNTGVARLWNELMYNCQLNGEFALRTNAQKAALQAGYNYDVRTTVDGFPIVVFHRQTVNSELVCLGQYNFNNDKSTEKVFGFTDIPGFDNKDVQCFEFLANESPICLFDDISEFDTKWSDAFESRYPDTKTPDLVPLKILATWINSCKENQEKWNEEKASHFDLPKLAAYYVYLMRFGAVDQTVKNAMITTEDGVHWFFINYDNDTIIGIDNISTVLNAWNYDRSSRKAGGAYYYAGHNSVLWNCFEADPECMALAREVDNALYSAGLTYANMVRMFDEEQCDKWCERIYNDNGIYKYIQPFKEKGSAVLYMLQGSRKSYRRWWLQHRMDLYDAMWATGAFRNRIVRFIAEGAEGGTFRITSASDTYFGYGINSVIQESGVRVEKNAVHDFTISRTLAIGDPVSVYNANNISRIDLSDFAAKMTTLYINQAVGNDGKSSLKSLILGDGTTENVVFTEIGGLSAITGIEEIDIRNFKVVTNVELSALQNLHIFKAAGSGLTSFVPATGVTLTEVSLPDVLQSIVLNGADVSSLTYTPATALRSVSLRNVTGAWDARGFVLAWLEMLSDNDRFAEAELTLAGIDWRMTPTQAIAMGKVGIKNYRGKITLPSLSGSEYYQLVELYGENVFKPGSSFIIDAPEGILLIGPERLIEGTSSKFDAVVFPASETPALYMLYNGTTLIERQQDSETGEYFRQYNNVRLWESTGVIETTGTISSSFSLRVRAQISGTTTYSDYITFQVIKYTYPDESSTSVQGVDKLSATGEYQYGIVFNTEFSADIASLQWSLVAPSGEGDNVVSIKSGQTETEDTTLVVGDEFDTAEKIKSPVTLQCLIRFYGPDGETIGKEYTVEKNVTVRRVSGIDCVYKGDGSSAVKIISSSWGSHINDVKSMEIDGVPIGKTESYVFNDTKEHEVHIELNDNTTVPSFLFDGCIRMTSINLANTFKNINNNAFYVCRGLTSIDIPDSVTTIGKEAFYRCIGLTNIELSDSLTSIADSVFYECSSLTSIDIPDSVTSIGSSAFYSCTALKIVSIGKGLSEINQYAFNNCTHIEEFVVDDENETFSSVDGVIFSKDKTYLKKCPVGKSGAYTIPNTVTTIDDFAFNGCSKLTSIVIPDSVTTIKEQAFSQCYGLTSIVIPDSVTSIGDNAFSSCSFTSIVIPDSVTSIGRYAFYGCNSLTSVKISNSVTSISSNAFSYCNSLKSIVIPDSVTSIGDYAFGSCALKIVSIGKGLSEIYYNAFDNSPIEEFVVDDENETFSSVDGVIFSKDKTYLKKCPVGKSMAYTIPNTVTTIDDFAFNYCYKLTSIEIPDSVTTIKKQAFSRCSGLTSIVIPDSVTSIGYYAFSNCTNLETITINLQVAPTYCFGTYSNTAGYNKRTAGTNRLYVPANATGYESGEWADYLCNSRYGGFTLSKTL